MKKIYFLPGDIVVTRCGYMGIYVYAKDIKQFIIANGFGYLSLSNYKGCINIINSHYDIINVYRFQSPTITTTKSFRYLDQDVDFKELIKNATPVINFNKFIDLRRYI